MSDRDGVPLPLPTLLQIYVTGRCNMRCPACYLTWGAKPGDSHMAPSVFAAIRLVLPALAMVTRHIDPLVVAIQRSTCFTPRDHVRQQHEYFAPLRDRRLDPAEVRRAYAASCPTHLLPPCYDFSGFGDYRSQHEDSERFFQIRREAVCRLLGVAFDRVATVDHHTAHAAYANCASPYREQDVLVFTAECVGDGASATVWIVGKDGFPEQLDRSDAQILGYVWRYVTLVLGMNQLRDEHKVMGLASFGRGRCDAARAVKACLDAGCSASPGRVESIAQLLADGRTVGRCVGRMEFGPRALGNRSILARANDYPMATTLNRQVKRRDWWMPFAPLVRKCDAPALFSGPDNIDTAFMTTCMQVRSPSAPELVAACHPQDQTARPQVLAPGQNPELELVLEAYCQRTGCRALVNTSFNLHGEPIVLGPADAASTFLRSELDALWIPGVLLVKRNHGPILE